MELSIARDLGNSLLKDYKLYEWTFDFDRSVRRFGVCKHIKREITLSKKLVELNEVDKVRDTILHEISHAIVGYGNGHNSIWKQKALEIGCNAERCYSGKEVVCPKHKLIGTCPSCKREIKRHKMTRIACGTCCKGTFQAQYLFEWKLNNQ